MEQAQWVTCRSLCWAQQLAIPRPGRQQAQWVTCRSLGQFVCWAQQLAIPRPGRQQAQWVTCRSLGQFVCWAQQLAIPRPLGEPAQWVACNLFNHRVLELGMTWSQRKACLPFLRLGLDHREMSHWRPSLESRVSSPCSIIDTRVRKEKPFQYTDLFNEPSRSLWTRTEGSKLKSLRESGGLSFLGSLF